MMAIVSPTLWSVMITPIFLYLSLAIIYWISSTAIGSTPAKGSSSKINLGSIESARAISQRRLSPPDNWIPRLFLTLERLNSSISDSSLSFLSAFDMSDISMTDMILSSTDILRNTEASCGRYPTPLNALLYIGRSVISSSSKNIRPPLGTICPVII